MLHAARLSSNERCRAVVEPPSVRLGLGGGRTDRVESIGAAAQRPGVGERDRAVANQDQGQPDDLRTPDREQDRADRDRRDVEDHGEARERSRLSGRARVPADQRVAEPPDRIARIIPGIPTSPIPAAISPNMPNSPPGTAIWPM